MKEQIGDKDNEIRKLQSMLFSLELKIRNQEEELRQKNIRINQQAETIQIHSEEIAKTHTRYAKFESAPIRYPSQQGLANRYQNQTPPKAYDRNGQPNVPAAQHYRTKWGQIPQNQQSQDSYPFNDGVNEALNAYVVPPPHSPGYANHPFVNPTGSPIPHNRSRNADSVQHTGHGSRSPFATPPRPVQPADIARDVRLTPTTSHGSTQGPMPPVPLHTPERSDSVLSKPRSTKDGAITPFGSGNSKQATLSKIFSDLFDNVVEFSYIYVNVPSTQADSNLPQGLKQRLMNAATKTTAAKIMSSQNTRYLLIAKVILSWIQVNIFREGTFAGLNQDIDNAVTETRKKIFNNTPAPVRFVFLQDIANQFAKLKKIPSYDDFISDISHKRAVELWNIVRPLMYNKIDGDWSNFHKMVKEAHQVAEAQLLDTAEFRLFFPKVSDPFNDASMMNMDPEFDHMQPDELMAQRANVRLGAIPQVMARVTSPDGNIMTKTLVKAGVLLKAGDQKK